MIAGRNVKHLLRTPQLLVASVAQTVMFLLLFRYVFGGSIQIPGMTFVDFLIPGYLATIATGLNATSGSTARGPRNAGSVVTEFDANSSV